MCAYVVVRARYAEDCIRMRNADSIENEKKCNIVKNVNIIIIIIIDY